MRLRRKTSYEKRFAAALVTQRPFLFKILRDEWDEIQQTAKREELIKRSKEIALTTAKAILVLAAFGGVIAAGAVAPNVFAAFGQRSRRRGYFDEHNFREATRYLRRKRYVRMERDGKEWRLKITPAGELQALGAAYGKLALQKTKRWDGLWRVVFSDIPERKKWERDAFRRKLEVMGFYRAQDSVFIFPYPCRKEVDFLVSLFFLGAYVRFIETPLVVPDDDLCRRFDL